MLDTSRFALLAHAPAADPPQPPYRRLRPPPTTLPSLPATLRPPGGPFSSRYPSSCRRARERSGPGLKAASGELAGAGLGSGVGLARRPRVLPVGISCNPEPYEPSSTVDKRDRQTRSDRWLRGTLRVREMTEPWGLDKADSAPSTRAPIVDHAGRHRRSFVYLRRSSQEYGNANRTGHRRSVPGIEPSVRREGPSRLSYARNLTDWPTRGSSEGRYRQEYQVECPASQRKPLRIRGSEPTFCVNG